ncbi:hypothetical protein FXO38_14466 [Capsicum annuum]|nr:hypothetical protein FXO38_14466 [Capsicum annuum]
MGGDHIFKPFFPRMFATWKNTHIVDDDNSRENPCVKTFVFVGDIISIKHSVLLTSCQPRWPAKFGAHLPYVLEKFLMFTFHVSLPLAFLNSLPTKYLERKFREVPHDSDLVVKFDTYSINKRERKREREFQVPGINDSGEWRD